MGGKKVVLLGVSLILVFIGICLVSAADSCEIKTTNLIISDYRATYQALWNNCTTQALLVGGVSPCIGPTINLTVIRDGQNFTTLDPGLNPIKFSLPAMKDMMIFRIVDPTTPGYGNGIAPYYSTDAIDRYLTDSYLTCNFTGTRMYDGKNKIIGYGGSPNWYAQLPFNSGASPIFTPYGAPGGSIGFYGLQCNASTSALPCPTFTAGMINMDLYLTGHTDARISRTQSGSSYRICCSRYWDDGRQDPQHIAQPVKLEWRNLMAGFNYCKDDQEKCKEGGTYNSIRDYDQIAQVNDLGSFVAVSNWGWIFKKGDLLRYTIYNTSNPGETNHIVSETTSTVADDHYWGIQGDWVQGYDHPFYRAGSYSGGGVQNVNTRERYFAVLSWCVQKSGSSCILWSNDIPAGYFRIGEVNASTTNFYTFCNHNGVCDGGESYAGCRDDCPKPVGYLNVIGEENSWPYSVIGIPSPGEIYPKNWNIVFSMNDTVNGGLVGDNDTLFSSLWDFDLFHPGLYTDTFLSFDRIFNYSTYGRKDIGFTLTDDLGATGSAFSSVLIVKDGINIYANVSQPAPGNIVMDNNRQVNLTPYGSYYAACGSYLPFACTGAAIENIPPRYNSSRCPYNIGSATLGKCCSFPAKGLSAQISCAKTFGNNNDGTINEAVGFSGVLWNIYKKNSEGGYTQLNLGSYGGTSIPWRFGNSNSWGIGLVRLYFPFGEYKIILNVTKEPDVGTAFTNFQVRNSDGTYCSDGRTKWINATGKIEKKIDGVVGKCDELGKGRICCPENYDCVISKCILSESYICSDYKTLTQCEGFNPDVAERSVKLKRSDGKTCSEQILVGTIPYFIDDCTCVWNGTKCDTKYNITALTKYVPYVNNPSGSCTYSDIITDNCDSGSGFMEYGWTATMDGDFSLSDKVATGCTDSSDSRTLPCPQKVQLPFFDWRNFAITGVMIAVVYFVSNIKKRNEK